MKAKLKRELLGWTIGGVASLQAMADCILLKVPNNVTPIIMLVVYAAVGVLAVRRLHRWAELTKANKRKHHRPVKMYTIGPEKAPEPETFLMEA